jgi:AtzE family amidohydrolase
MNQPMRDTDFDVTRAVDAMAPEVLADPGSRSAMIANLERLQQFARLLSDDAAPFRTDRAATVDHQAWTGEQQPLGLAAHHPVAARPATPIKQTRSALATDHNDAQTGVAIALERLDAMATLRATTTILHERALTRACHLDQSAPALAGSIDAPLSESSLLWGLPFAAKNLFDVKGCVTRAGSASTRGLAPALRDAHAIEALEQAGGVLVALTNMDELAYGFTGENGPDGDTLNPLDPRRISGGSSAGSAAVVAAGAVQVALGTDTNGSIRIPSALCGVFGLKPTFGRVSRRGCYPFVASLDHVGPMAASVSLLRAAYAALRAPDSGEPDPGLPGEAQVADFSHAHAPLEPQQAHRPLRVALLGGYFQSALDPEAAQAVQEAARILEAQAQVELRSAQAGRAAAFIITATEAGYLHAQAVKQAPESFGDLVRDRLKVATRIPVGWYLDALRARKRLTDELDHLLGCYDLLIAPATPCVAPLRGTPRLNFGNTAVPVDIQSLPMRIAIGMYTHPLTPTGVPIGVAPRITAEGLSVGVQLIAARWQEQRVLDALSALEQAGFCRRPA